MNIRKSGIAAAVILLSAIGGGAWSTANAVTAAEVSAACGRCHGLTVNAVVIAAGPGALGFTANVRGRDQATWASTITRMIGHGATVPDVSGTAAYLAGVTAQAATPTATPAATATTTPRRRPWLPFRPRPSHPGHQLATPRPPTPTATPSPTATLTAVPNNDPGGTAYDVHCALCHEPGSPGFVGETIYGKSANDIAEALAEVRQMQFLRTIVDRSTIQEIARYLGSTQHDGRGDQGGSRDD